MQCPKCEANLIKIKVKTRPEYGRDVLNDAEVTSEIEIDQCIACNGIWFDVEELDQYLDEKLLIVDSPKVKNQKKLNKKKGPCPKCGTMMVKDVSPNRGGFLSWFTGRFMIDTCKQCKGVWLDSTEIDRLEKKNFSWGEKHTLVFRNFKKIFLK